MKYILLLFTLSISLQLSAASEVYTAADSLILSETISEEDNPIPLHYFAAASGVLGIIFVLIPFLAPLGVLFAIAGLAFSFINIFRRKRQKKHWMTWVGLITSSLTILVFLGVLFVIYFFVV